MVRQRPVHSGRFGPSALVACRVEQALFKIRNPSSPRYPCELIYKPLGEEVSHQHLKNNVLTLRRRIETIRHRNMNAMPLQRQVGVTGFELP